tara:strand:+ start:7329 stop:7889 length:561 start_codon:yes stop_codon:yes gene_type:complete
MKIIYSIFLFILFPATFLQSSSFTDMSGGASVNNVETAGDILQVALPLAALGSTYILDDKNGRVEFWKAYLSSISLTYFLKYTIDKTRPNGHCCESFPSGHTTAAFSGAMFIQKKYGLKYGAPSLALASFVGYSRVYADKHYWEDVVVGASIGILGNILFTQKYNNRSLSFYKDRTNTYLTIGFMF